MKKKRIISSAVYLLAISAGLYYCYLNKKDFGLSIHPFLVPSIALSIMFFLGVIRLIGAIRMPSDDSASEKERTNGIPGRRMLLTCVLIIAYALLFNRLGFVIASILYLFGQICVLYEGKKKWLLIGSLSVAAPLAVYALFVYVFHVMLPAGILWF